MLCPVLQPPHSLLKRHFSLYSSCSTAVAQVWDSAEMPSESHSHCSGPSIHWKLSLSLWNLPVFPVLTLCQLESSSADWPDASLEGCTSARCSSSNPKLTSASYIFYILCLLFRSWMTFFSHVFSCNRVMSFWGSISSVVSKLFHEDFEQLIHFFYVGLFCCLTSSAHCTCYLHTVCFLAQCYVFVLLLCWGVIQGYTCHASGLQPTQMVVFLTYSSVIYFLENRYEDIK